VALSERGRERGRERERERGRERGRERERQRERQRERERKRERLKSVGGREERKKKGKKDPSFLFFCTPVLSSR